MDKKLRYERRQDIPETGSGPSLVPDEEAAIDAALRGKKLMPDDPSGHQAAHSKNKVKNKMAPTDRDRRSSGAMADPPAAASATAMHPPRDSGHATFSKETVMHQATHSRGSGGHHHQRHHPAAAAAASSSSAAAHHRPRQAAATGAGAPSGAYDPYRTPARSAGGFQRAPPRPPVHPSALEAPSIDEDTVGIRFHTHHRRDAAAPSDEPTMMIPGAYREGVGPQDDYDEEETMLAPPTERTPSWNDMSMPVITAHMVHESPRIAAVTPPDRHEHEEDRSIEKEPTLVKEEMHHEYKSSDQATRYKEFSKPVGNAVTDELRDERPWWKKCKYLIGLAALVLVALIAVVAAVALGGGDGGSDGGLATGEWKQLGQDISGEASSDFSAYSVAMSADGMTVAVGAPLNDDSGNKAGHVRVHRYMGGSWDQLGQDIDGESDLDGSGRSVSASADGNTIAIGAPWADNSSNLATGHVRVYKLTGEQWIQVGQDVDGTAFGDRFGITVSMSSYGTYFAVGADQYREDGSLKGYARVFHLEGNSWTQVGQTIVGEAVGDQFGYSVSMSADGMTVAIGANNNDANGYYSGHVRVYRLHGSNWSQVGEDIVGESGSLSGESVSLSANGMRVAIGGPLNNNSAGRVRVYDLVGNSWTKVGEDIDGKASNDQFGISVALSDDGTFLAVGANQYYNSQASSLPGYARIFQFFEGSWEQVGKDIVGEDDGDDFGLSVSMSANGKIVAIGGPGIDGASGDDVGHVRVYQLE